MQQAIEELERALKHLAKTEKLLPAGQVHDQDHYRQRILWDAKGRLQYLLSLLKRDPRTSKQEKEERGEMIDPYEKGYDLQGGGDPYDDYPTDPYYDIRPNENTKIGGRIFWWFYTRVVLPIARLEARIQTWRFEHRLDWGKWRRWWRWHRPWL